MRKSDFTSHGRESPTRISTIFDAMEFDMAMSGWPFRVLIMLMTTSGSVTPIAKNVSPIAASGIPRVNPGREFTE